MKEVLFPDYPPTLPNVIRECCAKYADEVLLIEGETRLTFAEVDRRSAELARGLLAAGIGKAGRVAILMPNCVDNVLCWLAAGRMGAFTIPTSTLFQPPELAWLLKHADIDTLLVRRDHAGIDFLGRVERALPQLATQTSPRLALASHPYLRHILVWEDPAKEAKPLPPWAMRGPDDLLAGGRELPQDDAFLHAVEDAVVPSDLLVGICTSGTMAEPKLVVHTHASTIRSNHSFLAFRRIGRGERDLSVMPLFWIGGLNVNLLPDMWLGGCMVFPPSPRTEDLLATMKKEGVTRVRVSLGQRASLLERARAMGTDITHLNGIADTAKELLGMTETFGPHGFEGDWAMDSTRAAHLGQTVGGIERRIVDPQTRAVLPPGQVGELQVKGFSLMDGYYKRERGEVFDPDGWFPTGDLCRLDEDGFLFFSSRLHDMIKTMGANVSPAEVQKAFSRFPGVNEAIVFGVPDAKKGEAVIAVVVPKTGQKLDAQALREALRTEISSYKVPSEIYVLEDTQIPRAGSGKVKKADFKTRIEDLRAGRFP